MKVSGVVVMLGVLFRIIIIIIIITAVSITITIL